MQSNITPSTCEDSVYNELFRTFSRDLYNFIYYKFGADFQPEDVVQEAFLQLWRNCKDIPAEKAKSYLFTVANNHALNLAGKKKTVLNYSKENQTKDTNFETPEFIMEEGEYMNKLQSAIESLTEEQRVAFMLNKVEGKRHKEIAEILGISRKAVEKRIYKAIANLKKVVNNI